MEVISYEGVVVIYGTMIVELVDEAFGVELKSGTKEANVEIDGTTGVKLGNREAVGEVAPVVVDEDSTSKASSYP